MSERFGYSRKQKGEIRKKLQNYVAKDAETKQKMTTYVRPDPYNEEIRREGIKWFNEGKPYEEGLKLFNNNTNFINGYNSAKRDQLYRELWYGDGIACFIAGYSREDVIRITRLFPTIFGHTIENLKKKNILLSIIPNLVVKFYLTTQRLKKLLLTH